MANYKIVRTITVGGVTVLVPNNATIKHLSEQCDGSNAADTMIDSGDGNAYAVATGKTFHLIGVTLYCDTPVAGESVKISSGDTENAETATIINNLMSPMITQKTGNGTEYFVGDTPSGNTWASAKFVVYNPSGTTVDFITMVGYEI